MASAPGIPMEIREAMRDCILALFWPRKKIIEFLRSVGASADDVAIPETTLSRHQIVMDGFARLDARDDRGYPIFQTMMDQLSTWTYFDPYYFEKLAKLDKGEAAKAIARLKQAIDRRNATTRDHRVAAAKSQDRVRASTNLDALKAAFSKMFGGQMTPQVRGQLFEEFLRDLFRSQSVPMTKGFRLVGEQIDGAFKFDGENYIVEAKWLDATSSTGDLYKFAAKVEGKMYGRGMFISVNGFSKESISAFVHGKHIKAILIDGEDISHVLEGALSLKELLDVKIMAAQTKGDVYICPLQGTSKV